MAQFYAYLALTQVTSENLIPQGETAVLREGRNIFRLRWTLKHHSLSRDYLHD